MPGLRAFSQMEYQEMLGELESINPHELYDWEQDDYALEVGFSDEVYEENIEDLETLAQRYGYEIFV